MALHGTMAAVTAYAFRNGSVDETTFATLLTLGFSAEQIRGAEMALITVEVADIRFRLDGTGDVDSADGHKVLADRQFEVYGFENLRKLQIICVSGSANLTVTLFRAGAPIADTP